MHFYDINVLIKAFERLVEKGNTIIVIEHNLDVIRNVDWVIDLGPNGGENGGKVMYSGPPDKLLKANTHTGAALQKEVNC